MALRIVRLGSPRNPQEGIRIGTVRRPPRGVPKARYSQDDWFDVWFPTLAPSVETLKLAKGVATAVQWNRFVRKYRGEMATPDAAHAIELLAKLSHSADISVGCYCEHEARCHRSVLRELLSKAGANLLVEGGTVDRQLTVMLHRRRCVGT